ncbi:MAG TPA: DUF2158 domain-containing protein [Nitrobacter sp.]|nr:DUF2158 domain-containing protein [Nitrobacter sp.]
MTLKVGDPVRLKSGGPVMTVDRVYKDRDCVELAHVVWYEASQQLRYACLPVEVFVKVPHGVA